MNFANLKNFLDYMAVEHTPGNAVEVYVDGSTAYVMMYWLLS